MYQDWLREHPEESTLAARRHVGGLLDINPATLRNWIEQGEVETGQRPGVTAQASEELKRLIKENAELRRKTRSSRRHRRLRRGGGRPPTRVIVAYIDAHKDRFGVDPICRVLTKHGMAIAPFTYYAHRSAPVSQAELADAYAANAVLTCWSANRGVYGVRKLWHALRREGHQIGRDQVGRLMAIVGISGAIRGEHRTRTTRRGASAARHPDLVQRGWRLPTRPDQWWAPASTYVWTLAGFV
jgi:hypothetical protein